MSNTYQITFTNPAKNTNGGIVVPEQQGIPVSNLTLMGRNYPLYGQTINSNFLGLLENFANTSAPQNPVEGQVWYDSANQVLKVNNAVTGWVPVNGVYEQAPDSAGNGPTSGKAGDIWVDTSNFVLYINNGSLNTNPWVLVGPNTSSGTKSGAYPTTLFDKVYPTVTHDVIIMYVDNVAVEIISKDSFTPQTVIPGFTNLLPGVNVSSLINGATPILNGIAAAATALRQTTVSGQIQTVSANSFVRNDTAQTYIGGQLTVGTDQGIRIGTTTSTFLIQKSGYKARISNVADQGKFEFLTYSQGTPYFPLVIDGSNVDSAVPSKSNPRVGINTPNPSSELEVTGIARVSKKLRLAFDPNDQIHTTQVLLVGGDSLLQGDATVTGSLLVGTTTTNNAVNQINGPTTFNSNILAASQATSIGVKASPFGALYVNTVTAASFIGGVFYGPATQLYYQSNFTLSGPIASSTIYFGGVGRNGGTTGTFITTVTNAMIETLNPYPGINGGSPNSNNPQLIPATSDLLMIYSGQNGTANNRMYSVPKSNFLGDVYPALCPTGSIMPFAGSNLPSGWVWCDGQRYSRVGSITAALFNAIGTAYGTITSADFLVPNLNGANNAGNYALYSSTATGTAGVATPAIGIKYMIKL